MKRLLLLLTLCLCFVVSPARLIGGLVYSDSTYTPLPDARCVLTLDDKEVASTVTAPNGIFYFNTPIKEALVLEIDKEGYSGTVIIAEAGGNDLDLGQIALTPASVLGEITVNATQVIQSKGRTIVYPSTSDVNASGSTLSLLQKLPLAGLDANPVNRSLSVMNGSPMILINGVPATMDDVNSLNPKDILKIEYSHVTPARYADKGKSGFIAFTLKEREDGGQIYAWGRGAVTTALIDANIRASYHQGSSQFSLQYTPDWRNNQDVYDSKTEAYIGDDGFCVDLESHARSPLSYHNHAVSLKYDFIPSNRTIFSARFTATPSFRKSRSLADYSDSYLGDYSTESEQKTKSFSPTLDLFLRRDFDGRNSLEVNMVGSLSSSEYRRDNTYKFSDGSEQSYLNYVNNSRRSLITEVSYIHYFNQTTSLSGGVQNTLSHNTNDYLTDNTKPTLTENNNYIYARIAKQFSKVYLTASTGAKMFWTRNDELHRHYIRNLSQLMASWYISPKWMLQASFQYTPSIPSLAAVTDHAVQTSPYLWANGNPDLKVSENFTYSLVASYQYKKFTAILMSTLSDNKNTVFTDLTYMGNGQFISQSVNAGKDISLKNRIQLKVSELYGFGANASFGVDYYHTCIGAWKYNLTSFSGSVNVWWNKGPYTISYYRLFPGKFLNAYIWGKRENSDILTFEYRPNKHWTLGVQWFYMFEPNGCKYPSESFSPVNPFVAQRYIKDSSNMIVLSATYTADFGALFKRNTRRSLENKDNGSSLLQN